MDPQVELTQLPELVVIGTVYHASASQNRDPGEIPGFWDAFFRDGGTEALPEAVLPGVLLACCYDEGEDGSFKYLIGAPVRSEALPAEGQVRLELPARRYARVTAKGEMAVAIPAVCHWLYREWLPSSGFELADGPELEWYDHRAHGGNDAEADILVPVR